MSSLSARASSPELLLGDRVELAGGLEPVLALERDDRPLRGVVEGVVHGPVVVAEAPEPRLGAADLVDRIELADLEREDEALPLAELQLDLALLGRRVDLLLDEPVLPGRAVGDLRAVDGERVLLPGVGLAGTVLHDHAQVRLF